MEIYHITITTTFDPFANAPFLIQTRAPFGVLDYRYANTPREALGFVAWMRSWHYGKFTDAPLRWIAR